ncbi:hypothetical protein BASA83_012864 [Batrachochytrium salamandrivorans]|nr:hypothetical protein BASA83_012864 [Batrachochytrium salamandrivorans]
MRLSTGIVLSILSANIFAIQHLNDAHSGSLLARRAVVANTDGPFLQKRNNDGEPEEPTKPKVSPNPYSHQEGDAYVKGFYKDDPNPDPNPIDGTGKGPANFPEYAPDHDDKAFSHIKNRLSRAKLELELALSKDSALTSADTVASRLGGEKGVAIGKAVYEIFLYTLETSMCYKGLYKDSTRSPFGLKLPSSTLSGLKKGSNGLQDDVLGRIELYISAIKAVTEQISISPKNIKDMVEDHRKNSDHKSLSKALLSSLIRTSIRAEAQGQPPVPRAPTISRHHCLEATDRIATSNYWDVLADGATDNTDTDTDIHQLTCQFLESANAVADNLSLRLSPPATRSNRRLLSGITKRAILASNTARQAFIAAATNPNPDPVQCNTLRDEWSRLKATATQLERADGRKQWVKHADNLDRAVSDGRTDLVFSAARAMSGNSSRSAAVTPLYNSNGIVQYDPTSILRVMQGHYGSLAADTTGHSLDLQYWHDRQPIQVFLNTPPIRNSDILDQDFSWNQIAAALLQMSPRKAPGDDGITTAFYQAALYMPADTQEGVPPTPFARALLRICGQVFASATIPPAWLCASIVSIDKKDGDPLNPGDKRGIALINVGLKLVCKVLQMRIERFVETNNLLSYEQAGFRKREECVGQVVSLVDIIQRRQNAGLNTHVLFIDIRKAFDTVPVGALLWKLQNMGFPRRTLAFLKALYTSSSARARVGSLLSDPFPVQRGVRQGCPLSGLLFNLFINDTLDGVAPITVPGLPRDTNPIRGLMYADDVAVFADSEQSLLAASTAIEQWANRWEMQFGVAKCGQVWHYQLHWPSSTTT